VNTLTTNYRTEVNTLTITPQMWLRGEHTNHYTTNVVER
jgi:hypothetical protein